MNSQTLSKIRFFRMELWARMLSQCSHKKRGKLAITCGAKNSPLLKKKTHTHTNQLFEFNFDFNAWRWHEGLWDASLQSQVFVFIDCIDEMFNCKLARPVPVLTWRNSTKIMKRLNVSTQHFVPTWKWHSIWIEKARKFNYGWNSRENQNRNKNQKTKNKKTYSNTQKTNKHV